MRTGMSRTARRNGEKSRRRETIRKNAKAKKAFTRAKAERLIASTSDPAVLRQGHIASHGNVHVQHKAKYKLAKLTGAAP